MCTYAWLSTNALPALAPSQVESWIFVALLYGGVVLVGLVLAARSIFSGSGARARPGSKLHVSARLSAGSFRGLPRAKACSSRK
ncbi:MAG: hypothetical protein M5U26_11340 [Planctomycetota bacterium]|nr:hypothetical protein [Planctomycetota bacterium]